MSSPSPVGSACPCLTHTRLLVIAHILFLISFALIGVAVYVPRAIHTALENGIHDYIYLSPDSQSNGDQNWRTFTDWTDGDSIPIYYNVRFWNLTNAVEAAAGGEPKFVEVGPYVFREYKRMLNPEFTLDPDHKKILKYTEWEWFEFQPQLSNGLSLSDHVTAINLPFQLMAPVISNPALYANPMTAMFVDGIYNQYSDAEILAQTHTVEEWLLGFKDDALGRMYSLLSTHIPGLPSVFPGVLTNITNATNALNSIPPDSIFIDDTRPDEARTYYLKNEQDYVYTVQPVPSADGKSIVLGDVPIWGSNAANRVRGGDGTQFQSGVQDGSTLNIWVSEVNRSVTVENRNNEKTEVEGIHLLTFRIASWILADEKSDPTMAPFYQYYSGIINVTAGYGGAPFYISKPHLLDADPRLTSILPPFNPNPELHDTYLAVEPISGTTMAAAKRLQLNVLMQPLNMTAYQLPRIFNEKVKMNSMLPVVWFEEAGTINSDTAKQFKDSVYYAQTLEKNIRTCCFAFALVAVVLAAVCSIAAVVRAKRAGRFEALSEDPLAVPMLADNPAVVHQRLIEGHQSAQPSQAFTE